MCLTSLSGQAIGLLAMSDNYRPVNRARLHRKAKKVRVPFYNKSGISRVVLQRECVPLCNSRSIVQTVSRAIMKSNNRGERYVNSVSSTRVPPVVNALNVQRQKPSLKPETTTVFARSFVAPVFDRENGDSEIIGMLNGLESATHEIDNTINRVEDLVSQDIGRVVNNDERKVAAAIYSEVVNIEGEIVDALSHDTVATKS